MTTPETGTIVQVGVGALNIGLVVYLVKLVISPLAQAVATLTKSVDNLYESRNNHEVKITQIETIHHLKGCDAPREK